MWHINILNKKRLREKEDYLVATFRIGDDFIDVMCELETYDLRDLQIVSYDLPFELSGTGYETIQNLHDKHDMLQTLAEMQDTVYGDKFKLFCDYFFGGNVGDYIKRHEIIVHLRSCCYIELAKELVRLGYIEMGHFLAFIDVGKRLKLDELSDDMSDETWLEKLVTDNKDAFLMTELKTLITAGLPILETELGFFINENDLMKLYRTLSAVTLDDSDVTQKAG